MQTVGSLHLISKCIRFHLNNLIYSIWMPVHKSCYWDLRYIGVVWQMCMFCWHFQGCVYVRTYSDDTLLFCSWDHGSAHIVCVDRTRRVRAVRRNMQRTHCCCGASAKLMGILESTFRTSQVWHQETYYTHKFVLLGWFWCTGLFVCVQVHGIMALGSMPLSMLIALTSLTSKLYNHLTILRILTTRLMLPTMSLVFHGSWMQKVGKQLVVTHV